jgi:hypothetical protein
VKKIKYAIDHLKRLLLEKEKLGEIKVEEISVVYEIIKQNTKSL